MVKATYAVKIESDLAEKVKKFCLKRGIKQTNFIKKALREQMLREEALEDINEFKNLKPQERSAVSLEQYLKHRR